MPTAVIHRIRSVATLTTVVLAAVAPAASAHGHHHKRHHHRRAEAHQAAPQGQLAVPTVCANADTSAVGAPPQVMRIAVMCLINQQRAWRGLPMLSESNQLDASAQLWTNSMVVNNVFTHGTDFWNRISHVGYDWSNVGENIATGFATPRDVVTAWMASPDHCRNILDPNYANVGTGVNVNPVASVANGPATWTQDFGLLMVQNAPSRNNGPANGCPYG